MAVTQIKLTNVSKTYLFQQDRTLKDLIPSIIKGKSWASFHQAVKNVSFEIKAGETVGLVGKNGAGKSTLLKLIAGVTYPDKGRVIVNGRMAPLIELGAGFHHELTGLENIYLNAAILGMHKAEIDEKLPEIIEFSELQEFIKVPIKRYSTGMYMRLAFSVAIHINAQILLIDEILAVGDIAFQKKCLKKLEQLKKDPDTIIIFVSHNEQLVRDFCDRALLIHQGKLLVDGSPAQVFKQYHRLL